MDSGWVNSDYLNSPTCLPVCVRLVKVPELECQEYIHALQREAERALYEHVGNRGNASRSGKLRVVLSTLRAVDPDAVAGLFLRPVTGTSSIDEHVLAMFCER